MIQWIGAICVVGACGACGFSMAASYTGLQRCLQQLQNGLELMQCQMEYQMTELPELCAILASACTGPVGKFFGALGQELRRGDVSEAPACVALTLARELSGAGEAEEALLELLCQAAEQQWEKRLRPGMTTEDCGKAFPCAVAFTAAADLAAARGGEGVSGFTAGSVSVRIRGAAESCALAESLRRTAERLMAPFAVPDDFCFRGVRG